MFVMPMVILAVRVLVDRVFSHEYPMFYADPVQRKVSYNFL